MCQQLGRTGHRSRVGRDHPDLMQRRSEEGCQGNWHGQYLW